MGKGVAVDGYKDNEGGEERVDQFHWSNLKWVKQYNTIDIWS